MMYHMKTRLEAARAVAQLRAAHADLFAEAPRNELGQEVVVAADASEAAFDVICRVGRAGGHALIVAVEFDPEGEVCSLQAARVTAIDGCQRGDWHVPLTRSCSIGELFSTFPAGTSVTMRLADEEVAFEDLARPDLEELLTPA